MDWETVLRLSESAVYAQLGLFQEDFLFFVEEKRRKHLSKAWGFLPHLIPN